ncbi:potassium transporter KefB [Flavobacterium sedimenticola]|uniref:Potassium transporter KefB n=1 Tax=Flavobacterium sedimenticola TaxID=3043286 RepID=A0ABT6XPY7_9FLAO|nr:potassium transporter KefB [Flavobacterium sedimenticola]MDI9257155.1 potassium transporter KefB [Flavobacterium sedimenticola]
MTQKKNTALYKTILIGATIAFAMIALFIFPIRDPNPEWGKFWMVKPLIIVPLAGATGGTLFYYIRQSGPHNGWKKVVALMLSILIYIIILWVGIVLGLDGTLWN